LHSYPEVGSTLIPVPTPYECDGAVGLLYGELPAHIEQALPRWIDATEISDAVELKAGAAYRVDDWAIKLVPVPRGWRRLRRAPALRAAEAARAIQPLRAPRPLLALQRRSGPLAGRSLLITEFVEGVGLAQALADDTALGALPGYLAAAHARGIFHGDLHGGNLLWDGHEWMLLDLESLRHVLHGLFSRRLIRNQWARLYRSLLDQGQTAETRFRELFLRYAALVRLSRDPEREWGRIVALAERSYLRKRNPGTRAL